MDGPAHTRSEAAESARPTESSRRATVGAFAVYVIVAVLVVAATLMLTGVSTMATDPCMTGSPCTAAFGRWLMGLWATVGLLVVACGFGVVRARSLKRKVMAVLCLPGATLIVWVLFVANSNFADAGVMP